MSTTSLTIRDRENVFLKMEDQLLAQGNLYVLDREFKLGKGINKTRVDFLMQYTSLLCNDNCDINSIIDSKIKGLDDLNTATNVSLSTDLSKFNDQYNSWLADGNSGSFLEYILSVVNVGNCASWSQISW